MHSSHDSGLLALGSSPVSRFDYDDNRWESTAPSDRGRTYVTMNENAFVRGVTLDTNQGIVYGFGRSADDITPWQLTLFNARENKAEVLSFTYQHSAPESNSALEPIYDLTARKIYVFQHKSPTKDNAVYSFSTSDRKWTRMRTTGDVPGYRKDPCFISVGSGNALLVGGSGENFTPGTNTALKDAYLLRLSTGVWTRVADAPTAYHGASVCIYHPGSDTAILWGGRSSSINTSDGFNNGTVSQVKLNTGAPMIYNLQNNVWQPYFKAAVNNRPESDYARPINAASTLRPQNMEPEFAFV
ncbi:hypothetical protein BGW38_005739 [Lunasporangiospora selenospora]|uniref:Galactose oxidase n=1 Tax=Lunasporangiospora selenospora TaxID=979761 RepID=A0A9P6FNF9_9FUNG|nr:hypothetical protein BGW38_005739 [Lunasporangiospora selenospora]